MMDDFETPEEFIQRRYRQAKAEQSLFSFLQQSWPYSEGGQFIPGWHLAMMSEILEAVSGGEIKKLLINVPPRTGKTSLVSVAFPAWVWLQNPGKRFFYCSFSKTVSERPSLNIRNLVLSDWYQSRWGDRVQLSTSRQDYLTTTAGGSRYATSIGATITGLGGDFLIADDPNDPQHWQSEAKIKKILQWWQDVWQSRLDSPTDGARIVIQQRISEKDITGYILASELASDWHKLILPMSYESSRPCMIQVGKHCWKDTREEGELLCKERFPEQVIEDKKKEMSAYGYAGQYQQRPAPQKGGIFRQDSFRIWPYKYLPSFSIILCSVDTALSEGEESSYSACTTWGVFRHDGYNQVMLLGLYKQRVRFKDLMERMRLMAEDYRDTGYEAVMPSLHHKPHFFLIEKQTLGAPLGQHLMSMGVTVRYFIPGNRHQGIFKGNKIQRAKSCEYFLGAQEHDDPGIVWIQGREKDNYDALYDASKRFLDDVLVFPNGSSKDVVDTMTQALLYLSHDGKIRNIKDVDKRREEGWEN